MFGALIIVFREVIEAGLIVGIVLAATRGIGGRGYWVAAGALLGALGACIVALFAEAIANDDTTQVAQWLSAGLVERVQSETAADFAARDPELWAVVVSPWVCVQERA